MNKIHHSLTRSKSPVLRLLPLVLVSALSACGGGGGGGNPPPPADTAPLAADDTASVTEDSSVTIDILTNDNFGTDGKGGLELLSAPANGTASVDDGGTPNDPADDSITYTPAANFHGDDSFAYAITDADGDSSQATVTVSIFPQTDFEIASASAGGNGLNPKMLKLAWEVDTAPHHFRIDIEADGASGFVDAGLAEIPGDKTSAEVELPLHLTLWEHDSFQLVALNESGDEIARSVEMVLSDVDVEQMIGYFKSSPSTAGSAFGYRVALSANGEVMAVSEPAHAVEGLQAGAVHIFRKGPDDWALEQQLENPAPGVWKLFGFNLALDGEGKTLSVVAEKYDESDSLLYIFTRGETEWTSILVDNLAAVLDTDWGFPMAFSSDGTKFAISAPSEGAAAVCDINDDIAYFGQDCSFMPTSGLDVGDTFGSSISISGDGTVVAVGAVGEDSASSDPSDNSAEDSGAVWVYKRSGDDWQQKAYLKAAVPLQYQNFGAALTLSADGSTLAVGAPGETVDTLGAVGAAYLFRSGDQGETWQQTQQLVSPLIEAFASFGRALSISASGEILAVGNFDISGGTGVGAFSGSDAPMPGAVHLYALTVGSWLHRNMVKASNTDTGDIFGWSLALSADGNSLAVGAPGEAGDADGIGGDQTDNEVNSAGAAYLY